MVTEINNNLVAANYTDRNRPRLFNTLRGSLTLTPLHCPFSYNYMYSNYVCTLYSIRSSENVFFTLTEIGLGSHACPFRLQN
jgi:hypothetical protein